MKIVTVSREFGSGGRELGKRLADVILKTFNPFNIFVHADMMSKIDRCIENSDNKSISKKEIEKNINNIDAGRLRTRELLSGDTWGAEENYHLTINTTDWVIKDSIIPTKEFADSFFRRTI